MSESASAQPQTGMFKEIQLSFMIDKTEKAEKDLEDLINQSELCNLSARNTTNRASASVLFYLICRND